MYIFKKITLFFNSLNFYIDLDINIKYNPVIKERWIYMKAQNKIYTKIIKSIAEKTLIRDANSTTCIAVYQPKTPTSLKKFSKINNDK